MSTPDYYIKNGHECQECIDMITADCNGGEAFIIGNIIKYLWRYKGKNGGRDLDKAKNYIDMLINKDKSFYTTEPFTFNLDDVDMKEKMYHTLAGYTRQYYNYLCEKIASYCKQHICADCKLNCSDFYTKYRCSLYGIPITQYFDEPGRLIYDIMRIIDDAK